MEKKRVVNREEREQNSDSQAIISFEIPWHRKAQAKRQRRITIKWIEERIIRETARE